jgi:hypothetical protein
LIDALVQVKERKEAEKILGLLKIYNETIGGEQTDVEQ